MKSSDIKERHIYKNRGKGKVLRFVLSIDPLGVLPHWYSMNPVPNEPVVKFQDSKGRDAMLYLSSFASWCGGCVCDASGEDFVLTDTVDFKLLEAFKEL